MDWIVAVLWICGGIVWYANVYLYRDAGSPIFLKVSMGSMFVCIGCLNIVLAAG